MATAHPRFSRFLKSRQAAPQRTPGPTGVASGAHQMSFFWCAPVSPSGSLTGLLDAPGGLRISGSLDGSAGYLRSEQRDPPQYDAVTTPAMRVETSRSRPGPVSQPGPTPHMGDTQSALKNRVAETPSSPPRTRPPRGEGRHANGRSAHPNASASDSAAAGCLLRPFGPFAGIVRAGLRGAGWFQTARGPGAATPGPRSGRSCLEGADP